MFNTIYNETVKYSMELPGNLRACALKSAVYGFAVETLYTFSVTSGLKSGVFSAVVVLVTGVALPIFHKRFADTENTVSKWQFTALVVGSIHVTSFLFGYKAGTALAIAINYFIVMAIFAPARVSANQSRLFVRF